jgi:hypothetical protein
MESFDRKTSMKDTTWKTRKGQDILIMDLEKENERT